jgi:hypothetical protein
MPAAPGQSTASEVPPRSAQDEVEMHSPAWPRLEVQLLISVHSGRSYPDEVGVADCPGEVVRTSISYVIVTVVALLQLP